MKLIGLTQRVEVVVSYGERRDCLDQNWATLLTQLGYCPIPLSNRVEDVDLYLATLRLDGVILTGGNDLGDTASDDAAPERDGFEHRLLDVCAERELPVFGVCRGVQMMNAHYGGTLSAVDRHVARRHDVRLADDFTPGGPSSLDVNSFHDFGITKSDLSKDLSAAGWAEDDTIEAVSHKSLPQTGIMWHPERETPFSQHDMQMIRSAFG
ncbi:MAG: gamma-glutamyl-gamma-aminobutyrate hydrolase family protein [Chloroflexi bacterium]|nr:gamma-glutamyl-gamma-aminobutyrate hydrolase family protein [Chloroflexota bacterium]